MTYSVLERPPTPETYCDLRSRVGLSARSLETAKKALPKTVFGCSVIDDSNGTTVGMGRIIGDDCFWTIVDIAVLPEHQKRGLGKKIMACLMNFVCRFAPKDCFVSLVADGDACFLYEKYGFVSTLPESQSMYYKRS